VTGHCEKKRFIPTLRTPSRTLSQLDLIQLFRREEKPNFNLISLNFKEAIAITIAIFGYKNVYNVP
jgi:hypothetical protein